MKTKVIFMIALLISASTLLAQNNKYTIDVPSNNKVDIDRYNKNAINGTYEPGKSKGITVTQFKRLDYYWEVFKKEGTPIEKRRFYNLSTGIISKEVNLYYNVLTGITKEYDTLGKLIKETDEDANYKFTIDDVIKFVKQKLDVDVSKQEDDLRKDMYRGSTEYTIYITKPSVNYPGAGEYLEIDSTTGEILYYKKDNVELINKGEPRKVILQ